MSQFDLDLSKFINESEEIANKIIRGTALGLFKNIVKRTPVDTGRLRANWQIDVNNIPASQLDDTDRVGGSTIRSAEDKIKNAKISDTIYIANNLPYASIIEEGNYSDQAPSGMVKVSILELNSVIKKSVEKNRMK